MLLRPKSNLYDWCSIAEQGRAIKRCIAHSVHMLAASFHVCLAPQSSTMMPRILPAFSILFLGLQQLQGQVHGFQALFVFGDSYVDIGNLPLTRAWNKPYGITWPGQPSGRFSDGHIQTDLFAATLGMPPPTNYIELLIHTKKHGINFAISGSGVTFGYGLPPLTVQVAQLSHIVKSGYYSNQTLANSLALICEAGNDYATHQDLRTNYQNFTKEVVNGILGNLKKLYDLGLRNMIVLNLPPFGCLPENAVKTNYTKCTNDTDDLQAFHNNLLSVGVKELNKLPGGRFIILDQNKAFKQIILNGGFNRTLRACCEGVGSNLCGDTDLQKKKLYSVCEHPERAVYWDHVHPSEGGYKAVVDLYLNHPGYVQYADTLSSWFGKPL